MKSKSVPNLMVMRRAHRQALLASSQISSNGGGEKNPRKENLSMYDECRFKVEKSGVISSIMCIYLFHDYLAFLKHDTPCLFFLIAFSNTNSQHKTK